MVSYWEYFVYNSKWGNHSGNATLLYYISISDYCIVYAFTCVRFYSFDNRYWLESYSLATSSWNSHPVYILRYIQFKVLVQLVHIQSSSGPCFQTSDQAYFRCMEFKCF